ncbi:MAG: cell division topological specificity factor [Candidatus Sericytochromatia bacterium]|nr:MAG: cell division topological specificity factor [Candidatus Sericytochromatia bacterium]
MSLLDILFGKKEKTSKEDAKKRLQLVLLHDRTEIPFEKLDMMKKEIFEVVSKYVDIDMSSLEVNLENIEDGKVALVANIPINKRKNDNQNN